MALIWVVGAGGLLGSTLRKIAPCVATTHRDVDITDVASLRMFLQQHPEITHIVNCSAYSLVDLAESHRREAFYVNAIGPENLGIVAGERGVRVLHISTDYVFPGTGNRPLSEKDPTGPLNYYGKTKLDGERRLLAALPSACVIRTSSLFGSGGKNFLGKLFSLFQEQEEVFLCNDQYNSPTSAKDLARAILQMLDRSGLYHFSNRGDATKYTFGMYVYERTFPKVTRQVYPVSSDFFPSFCKRPIYSVFDTTAIGQIVPLRPWQEALEEFLCDISVLS